MINERCPLQNQRRKLLLITPLKGGGLPIMAYVGRPHPKRAPFFRLQVYERVGILLVKVYERVRKSAISVCKKGQKGLQMHFMAVKRSEKVLGFWFVHTFKTVHLQELKGMQSSKRGKWKGYHSSINRRYAKGVPFLSNRYIKGKGLDLRRSLPI